jgi:hypothetical protein
VSGTPSGRKAEPPSVTRMVGWMFGIVPIGYGDGIASNIEGYRSWSSFLLERTRCVCFA